MPTKEGLKISRELTRKLAKGFQGRSRNVYRLSINRVHKALEYAYTGRKLKKRNARKKWIQQINAGSREYQLGYGTFINRLQYDNIALNRKMLAELAIYEPLSFKSLTEHVISDGNVEHRLRPKKLFGHIHSTVVTTPNIAYKKVMEMQKEVYDTERVQRFREARMLRKWEYEQTQDKEEAEEGENATKQES